MFKGASLTDIWTAINAGVQALNSLTTALKSAIITGPQGIQGPAGAVGPGSFPRSYLAGLTLSNDGSLPNTVLDIAAGQCTDSGNTTTINLGAFTKSTGGSWVLGTGNNGMGQGLTIANTTWYHVFAGLATGGAADVYFDTSVTAANAPAAFTVTRRIGSFLTDGSAHIIAFVQTGNFFIWATAGSVNSTITSTASLVTVQTPLNVKTQFIGRVIAAAANSNTYMITGPDTTDVLPTVTFSTAPGFSMTGPSAEVFVGFLITNTSSQIRIRASAGSNTISTYTDGYVDTRGQFA